jgi:hypothetical protein
MTRSVISDQSTSNIPTGTVGKPTRDVNQCTPQRASIGDLPSRQPPQLQTIIGCITGGFMRLAGLASAGLLIAQRTHSFSRTGTSLPAMLLARPRLEALRPRAAFFVLRLPSQGVIAAG